MEKTSKSAWAAILSVLFAGQLTAAEWQLVWQDEFSGPAIDLRDKWSFEVNCWGGGNGEHQCYTDRRENAFIEDGKLIIRAQKEDYSGPDLPEDFEGFDPNRKQSKPFTSARLRTKHKGDWLYGRFEIRAKLPRGQGSWPAIWMLPTVNTYKGWAASGEIDIMEAVNLGTQSDAEEAKPGQAETRVHGTLHYGRHFPENVYTGAPYTLPDGKSPADDFYTYAVEWQPGEIRWYVDDTHYATQTSAGWFSQTKDGAGSWHTNPGHAPFDIPFHLILNLAVGGNFPETSNEKGVAHNAFPQQMEVDFVRVYQCSKGTGEACATRQVTARALAGHSDPGQSNPSH